MQTKRKRKDKYLKTITFFGTTVAIGLTIAIISYIFFQGVQPLRQNNPYGTINIWQFITGTRWYPRLNIYGIFHMMLSTLVPTFWAVLLGIPFALGTAVFTALFSPKRLQKIITFFIETLAGIPSVFYGIFAFMVILPIINHHSTYPHGESLIAVIIVLAMMSYPTMCLIMISTLKNVDSAYLASSLALGTSKRQTILFVLLPLAKKGLFAGAIMGVTRAMGETMAVVMVAGNRESGIDFNPFATVRLLTTNLMLEQSYATELHAQLLWTTAIVLLLFIGLINAVLYRIEKGGRK